MTPTSPPGTGRPEELIGELVAETAKVPDEHRTFDCDRHQARSRHGISPELLGTLLAHGLSHRSADGEDRFDDRDLSNIALHLGLVTVQRRAIRSWGRELALSRGGPAHYRIEYVPTCPDPGHEGPCRYEYAVPGGLVREEARPPRGGSHTTTVRVPGHRAVRVPPELARLCADIGSYRFFLLPEGVRWSIDFMHATRLADCGGGSVLLARGATELGMEVRSCFGLLLARPFASPHFWTEVLLDGSWIPLDPILVAAVRTWSSHIPATVPLHTPPLSLLVRLSGDYRPIAVHDSAPVRLSVHVTRLAEERPPDPPEAARPSGSHTSPEHRRRERHG